MVRTVVFSALMASVLAVLSDKTPMESVTNELSSLRQRQLEQQQEDIS
jgi:hypothetical protein